MSNKTLYVGNIPYSANEEDILQHFADYSPTNPRVISGRGFAFVDIEGNNLETAIEQKHNSEMGGRRLTVNEARPRPEGGNGGFRGDRERSHRGGGRY